MQFVEEDLQNLKIRFSIIGIVTTVFQANQTLWSNFFIVICKDHFKEVSLKLAK